MLYKAKSLPQSGILNHVQTVLKLRRLFPVFMIAPFPCHFITMITPLWIDQHVAILHISLLRDRIEDDRAGIDPGH
jgi:hypothetical protein